MSPHDRPACQDCVHAALQLGTNGDNSNVRICLRVESQPAARHERTDGPIVSTISGQCGVNGRYFVPRHR